MRSKEYWAKRAEALEREIQTEAGRLRDDVVKAYRNALRSIDGDIRKTFKAYVATGVPEEEAKKLISAADRDKSYAELMRLYRETEDEEIRAEIIKRVNAQAYGARISRLEGVKNNIYTKLRRVGNEAQRLQKELYTKAVSAAYYTTVYDIIGGTAAGTDFALLPHRAVNKLLKAEWAGSNYSDRIWKHNNRFIRAVQQTVERGIIAGESVNQMAERLNNYVRSNAPDGIIMSTTRLVRTETSHFMNQGQLMAYEETGIKKYRFLAALSERTCDICGGLDGEEFDVEDAVEGENYPPIHPNCRCTTIMADAELSSRWARDPETGEDYKVDGDMTFEKWKDSFTPEQKAAFEKNVKKVRNKAADTRQYEKYVEVLGKKNVPSTFDKWQEMKYNKTDENVKRYEELKRRYKYENQPYLQSQLAYVMPNGEKNFIPDKTIINSAKTIAGKGSKTELRIEQRLVEEYGGNTGEWRKRVGKVESSKYIFDVHWYELDGKQYRMKLKNRSDKR